MKTKLYRTLFTFLFATFVLQINAQKFDKKFSEKFNVNKDVTVVIIASNSDINVETWNKNQVAVEAIIEVEGVSKKEAEKYFKNYKFEALGNKNKVQIISESKNGSFGNDNFVYFNKSDFNFPEINLPNFDDINFPDLSDIKIPEIDLEVINFDFDDFDFDFDKYEKEGREYFFRWKDSAKNITIKSKKEWEEFKKTKEYKKMKKELDEERQKVKEELERAREEIKRINKKDIKERLERVKIDKERMKQELQRAREIFLKSRNEMTKELHKELKHLKAPPSPNSFTIDGKKVKITKKIIIKVPASATFELNTRYSKVSLPNTTAYGKVHSGSFFAKNLTNSDLNISYAPVTIDDLNACTLFLKNVSKAKVSSMSNSNLNLNSSSIAIGYVKNKLKINDRFGEINVNKIYSDFKTIDLDLRNSTLTIPISNLNTDFNLDYRNSTLKYESKTQNRFIKNLFSVIGDNKTSAKTTISSTKNPKNNINLKASYSVINVL